MEPVVLKDFALMEAEKVVVETKETTKVVAKEALPCKGGRQRIFGRTELTQCNCSFYCTGQAKTRAWEQQLKKMRKEEIDEANRYRKGDKCNARKENGNLCSRKAADGKPYCPQHLVIKFGEDIRW